MTYLPPLGPTRPVRNDPAQLLEALTLASLDSPAACEDDDMFTADHTDLVPGDTGRMLLVCNRCPLFDPCRAYAAAERPKAGYWAGQLYGKPKKADIKDRP